MSVGLLGSSTDVSLAWWHSLMHMCQLQVRQTGLLTLVGLSQVWSIGWDSLFLTGNPELFLVPASQEDKQIDTRPVEIWTQNLHTSPLPYSIAYSKYTINQRGFSYYRENCKVKLQRKQIWEGKDGNWAHFLVVVFCCVK